MSIPHNFQSGFVFGIEFLAAFLMSSVMSIIGSKFSYRTLAVLGTFTLGVEVIAFGMLKLTDDAIIFLTLSYIIRLEIVYCIPHLKGDEGTSFVKIKGCNVYQKF